MERSLASNFDGISQTFDMNALRKILMPLLLIPLEVFVYVSTHPDWLWENPGLEYFFMGVSIPIVVINVIAWFYPEILRAYFPVKEDWGQRGEKSVIFATVVSAWIAFTCVGAGAISAVVRSNAQPTLEFAAVQPITATAFARSVQALSDSNSSPIAIVSTPKPSQEVTVTPEETAQIPVSGEMLAGSPTLSAPQTETTSVSVVSTSTVDLSARCTPAAQEYLDAVRQSVKDADPDSEVETGWAAPSRAAGGLWFVAAKIHQPESDTEATLLGVWGVFVYPGGDSDLYAINDVAMELSYADWGEDNEPVLTMQSDGAQTAYDCAAQAP